MKITKTVIDEYLSYVDKGLPEPAGYRVLLKPLPTREGMETAEAEQYEALAAAGFRMETDNQKEREDKGNQYHIVLKVGSEAYKDERLGDKPWVEVGDIAITEKYGGVEFEHPPGSREYYRSIADERILGVIKVPRG